VSLSLHNHETAIRTVARYWDELAALPRWSAAGGTQSGGWG
jgi:hypothetical protein